MNSQEILQQKKMELKRIIESEVFITSKKEKSFSEAGVEYKWIFDFKRVLLKVEVLNLLSEIFWMIFKERGKFQIGCLEITGVVLVTSFIFKKFQDDGSKTNGFFIRKSRKREGFTRMFEGCELNEDPVVLVDDSMNSGKSFIRQIEALESQKKKVIAVFTMTRFRDLEYYQYLSSKNIEIISIFELDDFKDSLGVENVRDEKQNTPIPFKVDWLFRPEDPAYFLVVPKSAPVLDDTSVYFGSDGGYFWSLDKETGDVRWKFKVYSGSMGPRKKGKHILSSPKVHGGTVYFGAYDGNVYALETSSGKKKWVNMDADWIGSSPALAPDISLLFVGLEFGLLKKKGGIGAIDMKTGLMKWSFIMEKYTHASPAYSQKNRIVISGSEEGIVYGFNAINGKVLWKFLTGGAIKASFVLSEDEGYIAFGSFDTFIYVLDIKSGEVMQKWETGNNVYSDAIFKGDYLYMGCTDKMVYCFNYKNGDRVWEYKTNGRIFASPIIVKDRLYIGSNDGILYELTLLDGKVSGMFQSVERIVNRVAFDQKTQCFYVPTVANELYKLKYLEN